MHNALYFFTSNKFACFPFRHHLATPSPLQNICCPKAKDLYIRSHGNYQPGQQRNRNYNWGTSNIDPREHVFGTTEKNRLHNGVGLCMDPSKDAAVPKSRITSKQVQDTKNLKDQLGRARNLGHGCVTLPFR